MNHVIRAVLLALLLSGCTTPQVRSQREPELPLAQALFDQQRYREAAHAFADAANASARRPEHLWLRAAEAWLRAGDVEQARSAANRIPASALTPADRARFALVNAELALADGDAERALAGLAPSGANLPPALVIRRQQLRAQALQQTGQHFAAAAELAAIDALLSSADRPDNRRQVEALLAQVDSAALYAQGLSAPPQSALRGVINRALAERGLSPIARGADGSQGTADWNLPVTPYAVGPEGYHPSHSLAVLLPLSGPLSGAGRAVLDGVLAAHFEQTGERPRLLVIDSAGSVDTAVAAYRQALDAGAERVLGPLDRDAVSALFALEQHPLPILALNRSGLPPPPGSASYTLSPEDEAVATAERMLGKGLLKAIAVGSSDEQSRRAIAAFSEHYTQRGGVLLASAEIPEYEANFSDALRPLFAAAGGRVIKDPNGQKNDKTQLATAHDAVFIALKAPQARLLVPQLAAVAIAQKPIFATALIVSGSGDLRLDMELEGIEFPEFPWLLGEDSALPGAEQLARTLPSARGASARLFGLGADGYRLSAYHDYLQSHPGAWLTGASGQLRIDMFGNVLRTPAWAVFSGGRTRAAIEPSLQPQPIEASAGTW